MKRSFLACLLTVLAACGNEKVIGIAPDSSVHIGVMLGSGLIVTYELPDQSWDVHEPSLEGWYRETHRAGRRSLDVAIRDDGDFDAQVRAMEREAERLRSSGVEIGAVLSNPEFRRVEFRSAPAEAGAPVVIARTWRINGFPSVYVQVILTHPPDDPVDLEAFCRTVRVERR